MMINKIFNFKNKKLNIAMIVVLLLILSQVLMVKLVYGHKINGSSARFFATMYRLKAGAIKDASGDINVYLKDFFDNKDFASKLLSNQIDTNDDLAKLEISEQEISDIVWNKLLKQAWLNKVAKENDIKVNQEDIDYYINSFGDKTTFEGLIEKQGISISEYKDFLIRSDVLETKVYDFLISSFADERGVFKIQEAYAFLESEDGKNWDEVVDKYGEDTRLSDNSFWLDDEELTGAYEAILEVEKDGFSRIVQVPGGYIIWHVDNISKDEDRSMREIRGLFVYAQSIDDFFNDYISSVNIKRNY